EVVTDADGRATSRVVLRREPARNRFRATVVTEAAEAGEVREEHAVPLLRWASTLTVSAPTTVVGERRATVSVTWLAANGAPVRGVVRLQRKVKRPKGWTRRWRRVARVETDARGRAEISTRPRRTVRWRVQAAAPAPWVAGDTSGVTRTRNRPPGTPVQLPRA